MYWSLGNLSLYILVTGVVGERVKYGTYQLVKANSDLRKGPKLI